MRQSKKALAKRIAALEARVTAEIAAISCRFGGRFGEIERRLSFISESLAQSILDQRATRTGDRQDDRRIGATAEALLEQALGRGDP